MWRVTIGLPSVKEIKPRLREILTELCEWLDVTIIEGAICSDHVHMYLSVPPKYSPSHMWASIVPIQNHVKEQAEEQIREEQLRLCKDHNG